MQTWYKIYTLSVALLLNKYTSEQQSCSRATHIAIIPIMSCPNMTVFTHLLHFGSSTGRAEARMVSALARPILTAACQLSQTTSEIDEYV